MVHGFLIHDTKLGQGRDAVKLLNDNHELSDEIEQMIKYYKLTICFLNN